MAGDWIKLETTTPDKPEVFQMADDLGIDPDEVLGKLIRVWIWADQQTFDGHAARVTETGLDRVSGVKGFAKSMRACAWLADSDVGLTFPNFDRHNGNTAKTRALALKRKQIERSKVSRAQRDKNAPIEKEKENNNKARTLRCAESDLAFAKEMFSKVREVAPKAKTPNFTKWANDIRLLREDGNTLAEIREVFAYANADREPNKGGFCWATNCKCPRTLRKQFAEIHTKMVSAKRTKSKRHTVPPDSSNEVRRRKAEIAAKRKQEAVA